jgi:hypothetical protein
MSGCELMKCTYYIDGKCHYDMEICRFRLAEINTVFNELGVNDYSEEKLLNNGISQEEIDYVKTLDEAVK